MLFQIRELKTNKLVTNCLGLPPPGKVKELAEKRCRHLGLYYDRLKILDTRFYLPRLVEA